MGGYGSGRPRQRPSLWSLYSVRTKQFRQACNFKPGMSGSISFDDGTKILLRSDDDCVHVNDRRIGLLWTEPHFGGARAWFECPACWRRTNILYGRQRQWACQRCWNGNYPSQKEAKYDRLIRRAGQLRHRLGQTWAMAPIDHVDFADCPPERPPRMHHRTYANLTAELGAVERAAARLFHRQCNRILGRTNNLRGFS